MSVASALFPSLGHRWLQLPTFGAIQIQFQISMSYPKGAHSITHLRGQLLTFWGIFDSVSNYQYATPRGLIRLPTFGWYYSLFGAFWIQFQIVNMIHQGGSFDYPPFSAITHFLGILDSGGSFDYPPEPRGHWVTVWIFKFSFWIGPFFIQFQISLCFLQRNHLLVHH